MPGTTNLPAMDATFTTCPLPRSTMCGITARMPWIRPQTFTSIVVALIASSSDRKSPSGMTPALLTSTSIRPKRSTTAPANKANESRDVTSRV